MDDVAKRYEPASIMTEAAGLVLMAPVVMPENLKEVRCFMEYGRMYWLMEWRTEDAKVRYERKSLKGDKPIFCFPEDDAKGYMEHFYVHDSKANTFVVFGSLRLDSLSFYAKSVADRMAEELENMFNEG